MTTLDLYRRLYRLARHCLALFTTSDDKWVPWRGLHYWLADLVFLLLDVLFLPEVHAVLSLLAGIRGRRLTAEEEEIANKYFGGHIDCSKVRLWDGLGGRLSRRVHAFVTFNTINCTSTMSKAILVHELVHIWQYQQYGSLYIPRALAAQWSQAGYDYGGPQALYHHMVVGGSFLDYNFEQQGDIFQHYYSISEGEKASTSNMQLAVYAYFVDQVRT